MVLLLDIWRRQIMYLFIILFINEIPLTLSCGFSAQTRQRGRLLQGRPRPFRAPHVEPRRRRSLPRNGTRRRKALQRDGGRASSSILYLPRRRPRRHGRGVSRHKGTGRRVRLQWPGQQGLLPAAAHDYSLTSVRLVIAVSVMSVGR